jgi:ABC-type oligopeptide transport system ATPase subunit
MARTTGAIRSRGLEPHEEIIMSQSMTYSEELLHSNPGMDSVRAQQLENWAEQREISNHNKNLYYENPNEYDFNMLVHEEVRRSMHWCET